MPQRRQLDRRPRISPTTAVELDRRSSLAEGLAFYSVARAGAGKLLDLAKPRVSTAATWQGSPAGLTARSCQFTNAATTDLAFVGSVNWTVLAYFFQNSAVANSEFPNVCARAAYASESNNQGWSLDLKPPNDGLAPNKFDFAIFHNASGADYVGSSNAAHGVGLWSFAGVNNAGTQRSIYINGKADKLVAGSTNAIASTGPFVLGDTRVQVLMVAAWSRALSASELGDLHQRPFLLARPSAAPVSFVPPAGGNRRRRVLLCSGGG